MVLGRNIFTDYSSPSLETLRIGGRCEKEQVVLDPRFAVRCCLEDIEI